MNPGIVRLVEWLRVRGFKTTDSGDGATHDHPCDRPYPYVSMVIHPRELYTETVKLKDYLVDHGIYVGSQTQAFKDGEEIPRCVCIQASFDPGDGLAIIDLMGMSDKDLPEGC